MLLNWDDGNNDMFASGTDSEEAQKFKQSKQGQWISRSPKFKEIVISDADDYLASAHLKFSPHGILFEVILATFSNNLSPRLASWIYYYRMNAHLFGCAIWNQRWHDIVSFKLHFIITFRHQFFNNTADLMTVHDLPAKMSDWIYSSLIDIPAPALKEPRMLLELRDHNSAPPSAALQPLGRGCKRHCARAGAYAFGTKNIFADRPMLCAVAAIGALVLWIAGVDVLDQANDRFLPMNNVGVSFAILSLVEIVHELVDLEFLPAESAKRGSIVWKSNLFRELVAGFYWVQLDLRNSVQFTAEHDIAAHIMKD